MDDRRLTDAEPQRHEGDVVLQAMLRRRARSRALLAVLLGLAALFYAMTLARFGEQAARREASGPQP